MSADAPSLIPKPAGDDPEDVAWALSTAEVLWKRGDYHDAVSWVRKAATAASEADADMRVIQLAKAAAELATMVEAFAEKPKTAPPGPAFAPPVSGVVATVADDAHRPTSDSLELDVDVSTSMEPDAPPSSDASPSRGSPGAPPEGTPWRGEVSVVTSAPPTAELRTLSTGAQAVVSTMVGPTPNPMPSPLRIGGAGEFDVPVPDEPIEESAVAPNSVRAVDSRRPPPGVEHEARTDEDAGSDDDDDDSMPRVPTVPPEAPDYHPTPMRMAVAPVSTGEPSPAAVQGVQGAATAPAKAGRLITAISLGRPVDVRADRRDAVAVGPPLARAPLREPAAPYLTAPVLPKPPAMPSTVGAPRVRTLISQPPPPSPPKVAPPVAPAPRAKPASIPPPAPGRPLSARPPAPPERPLALDLGERSSLVQSISDAQDAAAAVGDTHERLAATAPTVAETQQGLGAFLTPPPKHGPEHAEPALRRTVSSRPPVHSSGTSPATRAGPSGAIDLQRFEALADVPDDERARIVATGQVIALLPDEEIDAPALVLVLHGELEVRTKGRSSPIEIVPADQLRILAPVPPSDGQLIVVGGRKGSRLLALPAAAIEALRAAAPWVVQDLEPGSDDLHVVAGALRGEIGRRLDDALLGAVLARADTMRLGPGATVVKQGELVRALVILGAGALSLRAGDDPDAPEIGAIEPGEVLFPSELLTRAKAPSTVRAGAEGAVVLVATRGATEELMMTYPPLLDILSQG